MISLLYREKKNTSKFPKENFGVLMLNEALGKIIPEDGKRAYFLNVLSEPLVSEEDIRYRRDILKDFLIYRGLSGELQMLFDQMIAAVVAYNKSKQAVKGGYGQARGKTVESELGSIRLVCVLLQELISVVKKIAAKFSALTLHSEGLTQLSNKLRRIAHDDKLRELVSIVKHFEIMRPWDINADISFSLDHFARISDIKFETGKPNPQSISFKKDGFFSKKSIKADDSISENAMPITLTNYTIDRIVGQSLTDILDAMIDIVNSILSDFSGIDDDLVFYECACRLCDKLEKSRIPYTFPVFHNEIKITSLYDLFLLFCSEKEVIPNDVLLSSDVGGILIHGDNGSGKTVYLRSITTALLFSHAGLPIPAIDATIKPLSEINILAASSEGTLDIAEDAGRFEEEVQKIAKLVKESPAGSLVMLNEIFQTTSYSEGAEGLYPILKYFNSRGINWICVTHLLDLLDMFKGDLTVRQVKVKNKKIYYI